MIFCGFYETSQESILPGCNKLEKHIVLMIFYDFCEKHQKSILPGGFKRGQQLKAVKKHENYSGRFPEGVQKEEIQ